MNDTANIKTAWPEHLHPGALRWARASTHYEATVAFYRDLVGLPVVGDFAGSFSEDGTIFGLPDTGTQLEIVRAHDADESPGSVDQLIFYLRDAVAVTDATKGLRHYGLTPQSAPPAYWAANGAVIFDDPDGRGVVFAPWIYGRDPEPSGVEDGPPATGPDVEISEYLGDRAALRALFEEAEDSATQLDSYLHMGRVLVARDGPDVIGHLQLTETSREGEVELKNMAVQTHQRGAGIGRRLIDRALRLCDDAGITRMIVATAAADIGNLRFYQRCGFRFCAVERDAFTAHSGYPDPITIDGISLRDRVWLSCDMTALSQATEPRSNTSATAGGANVRGI